MKRTTAHFHVKHYHVAPLVLVEESPDIVKADPEMLAGARPAASAQGTGIA